MSTSPVSLELQAKIADWRLRAITGDLTVEEMIEAAKYLRAGRCSAATAQSAARKTAKAVVQSAEDLLSELDGM